MTSFSIELNIQGTNSSTKIQTALLKALVTSGCVLTRFHIEGTYTVARLEVSVQGNEAAIREFNTYLEGWAGE